MVKRGRVTVDEELYTIHSGHIAGRLAFYGLRSSTFLINGVKKIALQNCITYAPAVYLLLHSIGFGDNTHESKSLFDLFSGPRHPKSLLDLKPAVQSLHEI